MDYMNKEQLLSLIKAAASQHLLTKDEITEAYQEGINNGQINPLSRHIKASDTLYYVGGFIIFLGIVILVFQHWTELHELSRIFLTLVVGIIAFCLGLVLERLKNLEVLGYAFHIIALLLLPIGLFVTIDVLGFKTVDNGTHTFVSSLMFTIYLLFYLISKKDFSLLSMLLFSTWLFFAGTNYLLNGTPLFGEEFFQYQILTAGVVYLLLGDYFRSANKEEFSSVFLGIGVFATLGIGLWLGGWKPNQNIFWEIAFPLMSLTAIVTSTYFKNRAFIIFGTIFLMIYILKITGEYFSDSMGWPISLVLAGFMLMGVGYLSFKIGKGIKKDVSAPIPTQISNN
jgi:hypothetical protein